MDPTTWGWIKLIAGVVAFWYGWQTYPENLLALPVLVLAGLQVVSGISHVWHK
ncbi:MAG: hypothetical protein AABX75_02740 [Nanoarchaeota archaeon]